MSLAAPRPPRALLLGLVATGFLVFVVLWADVALGGPVSRVDEPLADGVLSMPASFRYPVAERVLSAPGDHAVVWPLSAVGVAACLALRRRLHALLIAAGSLGTFAFVRTVKGLEGRPRPDDAAMLDAFPSGHTALATIVWGLVLLLVFDALRRSRGQPPLASTLQFPPRAVAAWAFVAVLTGVARVLAGVHWVTDVVASWALGLVVVLGALLLLDHLDRPPEPRPAADAA